MQPRLVTNMQFLQVNRLGDVFFQLGEASKIETEFFPLMGEDDSSLKSAS